jgi:hypothetical protein
LLSKSNNWNKSKNSNEERIDFLLQNQWNNYSKKKFVDHFFMAQRFEEEVNNLLRDMKKDNLKKKEQIHWEGQSLKKNLSNILSKKRMCHRKNL